VTDLVTVLHLVLASSDSHEGAFVFDAVRRIDDGSMKLASIGDTVVIETLGQQGRRIVSWVDYDAGRNVQHVSLGFIIAGDMMESIRLRLRDAGWAAGVSMQGRPLT
jgi:hypothetical protein